MNKYNESKYLMEEFHRGKWQPLMDDKGVQKFALITEDQAKELNMYADESAKRYVLAEEKKPVAKKEPVAKKDATAKKSNKKALQEQYTEVTGKKPFPGWKEDQLEQKIAEATK